MTAEIYQQAVEDSFRKLKNSLLSDVSNEDFPWDLLIEMLIIESSPLAEVFNIRTLQLAELYSTAKHLSTVADDIENHDNDATDDTVSEQIKKAEVEAAEAAKDQYADFEDV